MSEMIIEERYLSKGDLQIYVRGWIPGSVADRADHSIPAIIISHGFGANCRGEYDYCEFFARNGYAAYCFDFCGGSRKGEGRSSGDTAAMNVWTECEDLMTVLAYVKEQPFVDSGNITLMGTSQGGFVSGLTAARCKEEVKNLVMICPALCIPDDARRGHLGGASYDVADVPDEIVCPNDMVIGKQFHEAVVGMDPSLELAPYEGNVLLIQGMRDMTVNYSYAVKLANHYGKGQCRLKLVRNAAHGFSEKLKESAMVTILNFLEGKEEILTIQVFITGREVLEQKGDYQESIVYFTGYCDNEYFKGAILPGAKDVQIRNGDESAVLRAEYTLHGTDCEGHACEISIVNQRKGEFFYPQITTDSPALSYLNSEELIATLEGFENGLTVRIFGKERYGAD
ncbi:MAG: lysophospholipase [Candidatus Gastranaerophilales bacterium]|nr:lysophospholipase [Candidatus Gastranaerophilales bacterium]